MAFPKTFIVVRMSAWRMSSATKTAKERPDGDNVTPGRIVSD